MSDRASQQKKRARDLVAEARRQFEAGAFSTARAAYEAAFEAGDDSAETVGTLQTLYADAGDLAGVVRVVGAYLERNGERLAPRETIGWESALFDAVAIIGTAEGRKEAALRLLEAAVAAGEAGWRIVREPERWSVIDAVFEGPLARLELLEQAGYAPAATGLPASAAAEVEEIGRRYAAETEVARAAERLLHGRGEREAAYRVEAARRAAAHQRRQRERGKAGREREANRSEGGLRAMRVLVVGGHPGLRAMVRADLERAGVAEVREVPSKWEGVRQARSVGEQVAGADVAVLIGRRIAHSTSDQVRAAALRFGVPVAVAATAGVGAVRRALEEHARRKRG